MNQLTEEQVRTHEERGFLIGISVLDTADAVHFREWFDALEREEGRDKCGIGILDRHVDQEFIWEMATHPRVLDVVEDIYGPDIMLLATHFFCKYGPDTEKFVAWHQDVTYWGLEPPEAITAWYAVDDSDIGNGCMRVIPGSHREGIREHGTSERKGNLLSVDQEVPVSREEEASAVDMSLRAGEISLHDGALIHSSLPNQSTRRRCGLTLRYIRPSTRPIAQPSTGKGFPAVLVRGIDKEKNFGGISAPFPVKVD